LFIQSPEEITQSGGKTNGADEQHQVRLGVEMAVEKISDEPARNGAARDQEWELHGQRRLAA
jgi:hypothetical protein